MSFKNLETKISNKFLPFKLFKYFTKILFIYTFQWQELFTILIVKFVFQYPAIQNENPDCHWKTPIYTSNRSFWQLFFFTSKDAANSMLVDLAVAHMIFTKP